MAVFLPGPGESKWKAIPCAASCSFSEMHHGKQTGGGTMRKAAPRSPLAAYACANVERACANTHKDDAGHAASGAA
jgi:hypothetical protein